LIRFGLRRWVCKPKPKMESMSSSENSSADDIGDALLDQDHLDDRLMSSERPEQQPKHQQSPDSAMDAIIRTVLFVLYLGYAELAVSCFDVFVCEELVEGGVSVLEKVPWITCEMSNHTYFQMYIMAIVFTVAYVIGIPVLFGVLLFRNRAQIIAGHHVGWLAYLCEDYQPRLAWYYELVWLLRRAVLSLAISVLRVNESFQAFAVVLILSGSVAMDFYLQPFQHPQENMLLVCSLLVLVTSFSGFTTQGVQSTPYQWFITVLNGILVFVLVGYAVWPFAVTLWRKCKLCYAKRCKRN
jgi:hypothetical protein